nr:MAG TPA: hypothetical protein [Caudoviricetes sp.]
MFSFYLYQLFFTFHFLYYFTIEIIIFQFFL